jgi:hypothetical protein
MHIMLKTLSPNFRHFCDNYRKQSKNAKFVTIYLSHSLTGALIQNKDYPFTDFSKFISTSVESVCDTV